jgi:hypothetical protein
MKATIPVLVMGVLLAAYGGAFASEPAEALRAYVRNSSFTIVVPAGWSVEWKADSTESASAKYGGRVFEIASAEGNAKGHVPTIYGSFYRNKLPAEARKRWEWPADQNVELAPIDGLSRWTLVESASPITIESLTMVAPGKPASGPTRSLTAYRAVGWDTLYIWFRAPDDGHYEQGKQDLLEMLKSYREEKIFIGP